MQLTRVTNNTMPVFVWSGLTNTDVGLAVQEFMRRAMMLQNSIAAFVCHGEILEVAFCDCHGPAENLRMGCSGSPDGVLLMAEPRIPSASSVSFVRVSVQVLRGMFSSIPRPPYVSQQARCRRAGSTVMSIVPPPNMLAWVHCAAPAAPLL